MSKFFDDTMQGLLEAVAINQKQIPVKKVDGLQADTFRAEDIESNLIDSVVKIRKESNISQKELADLTESKQQSISRFEKKMHSPSLILFVKIIDALGYKMELVKKYLYLLILKCQMIYVIVRKRLHCYQKRQIIMNSKNPAA